jgi:hypothetical protein
VLSIAVFFPVSQVILRRAAGDIRTNTSQDRASGPDRISRPRDTSNDVLAAGARLHALAPD